MSDGSLAAGYVDEFRARGEAIADACTRCGDCFRACPMVEPAGLGAADAGATTAAIVDLVTGGAGSDEAVRRASRCSGSGNCIPACNYGVNPRFMVQLARGFARARTGDRPLSARWRQPFQGMSRGVRVLSRLQMPPETLGAPARARHATARPSARGGLLHRLQHPEDAPHRTPLPRHPRPARRRLRGDGRRRDNAAASTSSAKAISTRPRASALPPSTGWPRPAPRPFSPGARAANCRSERWRCRATNRNSACVRSS